MRLPPGSPLFPYTTLFRSGALLAALQVQHHEIVGDIQFLQQRTGDAGTAVRRVEEGDEAFRVHDRVSVRGQGRLRFGLDTAANVRSATTEGFAVARATGGAMRVRVRATRAKR